MRQPSLADLIAYVGRTPLRAGRVALAVILFRADFEAFLRLGDSITGSSYVKADVPGETRPPRNPIAAVVYGYRWGSVEHRLLTGTLRRRDAEWVAAQWADGVPV